MPGGIFPTREAAGRGRPAAADWLALAATPCFGAMALLTGLLGRGEMAAICGAAPSFLAGMLPMYLLMSAFHSGPWLGLLGRLWEPPR